MSYPIILISGWGMPTEVMEPLSQALQVHHPVSIVQLPGLADESTSYNLETLLAWLDQQLPAQAAVLLGWSLGGVLAIHYASRFPDKTIAVVNLTANACFVANKHWPEAMTPALFARFCQGLSENCAKTLQQFALLCSTGSVNPKAQARTLQQSIARCRPEPQTLLSLLAILGESDLRAPLADIRCPVSHLFGQNDALVPVTVAAAFRQQFPTHRVHVVAGGHSFFLDDPTLVLDEIAQLLPVGVRV